MKPLRIHPAVPRNDPASVRRIADVSRRRFLTGIGVVAGTAVVTTACGSSLTGAVDPETAARGAPVDKESSATGKGTLVVVFLAGGNDGLNTIVPVTDDSYYDIRGELAVDPATTTDLGEGFGLAPELAALAPVWEAGDLAIVHGAGVHGGSLSHFDSTRTWHAAAPNDKTGTGWIGRWLDAGDTTDPLRAVTVGSSLSPTLQGAETAGAVVATNGFGITGDADVAAAWNALAEIRQENGAEDAVLSGAYARAVTDIEAIEARLDDAGLETGGAALVGERRRGGGGGGGLLGQQLTRIADLIAAGVGTRVFTAELGGFDTHSGQENTHARLLGNVNDALESFLGRLDEDGTGDDVTVMVWSEFGRRAAFNGSGTDHGTSGPVFFLGKQVQGGHYGDPATVGDLDDDGNLKVTTDYRAALGSALEAVLGTEAAAIIPDAVDPLPVF